MHVSGELCLLFFKLAAPMHVLFFKVARSPFKQKYGTVLVAKSKMFYHEKKIVDNQESESKQLQSLDLA